jgi:hypothetical protein
MPQAGIVSLRLSASGGLRESKKNSKSHGLRAHACSPFQYQRYFFVTKTFQKSRFHISMQI